MSSVTTERRPVVQRGMNGWMRGEPMSKKSNAQPPVVESLSAGKGEKFKKLKEGRAS
jgi:hypothetical protein